jgi:hypothetical protein
MPIKVLICHSLGGNDSTQSIISIGREPES